jgi:plastocyanin
MLNAIRLVLCVSFGLWVAGVEFRAFAAVVNHQVIMKSISFDPKSLEIKRGDTIEWLNRSYTEHSATSEANGPSSDSFDTGLVKPQKISKKIGFPNAGTYQYHCSIHGKTMSGQVVVAP